MIVEYYNETFNVPDNIIDEYVKGYTELKNIELKEELDILRNCVYQLLILVEKAPRILNKESIRDDFLNTLAMKEALFRLNLLHDA